MICPDCGGEILIVLKRAWCIGKSVAGEGRRTGCGRYWSNWKGGKP